MKKEITQASSSSEISCFLPLSKNKLQLLPMVTHRRHQRSSIDQPVHHPHKAIMSSAPSLLLLLLMLTPRHREAMKWQLLKKLRDKDGQNELQAHQQMKDIRMYRPLPTPLQWLPLLRKGMKISCAQYCLFSSN